MERQGQCLCWHKSQTIINRNEMCWHKSQITIKRVRQITWRHHEKVWENLATVTLKELDIVIFYLS